MKSGKKNQARIQRHWRVRKKIKGTAERPRMAVFKSNKNLYVQFIDDVTSNTLASASSMDESFAGTNITVEGAAKLGQVAADAAKAKGIESVVFDRGGFRYAGKIAALADSAREAGLKF